MYVVKVVGVWAGGFARALLDDVDGRWLIGLARLAVLVKIRVSNFCGIFEGEGVDAFL